MKTILHTLSLSVVCLLVNGNPPNSLEEGHTCYPRPNKEGVCRYISGCPDVQYDEMLFQLSAKERLCKNDGSEMIVCCSKLRKSEQACIKYRSAKKPHGIIKGTAVTEEKYPHMVALVRPKNYHIFCGGSLISELYVLTAAHCLMNLRPQNLILRMGKINLTTPIDEKTDFKAEKFIIPKEYPSTYYDIALIKLQKPVKFSTKMYPACLNEKEKLPAKLYIAGWGSTATSGGRSSKLLMEANVDVHERTACEEYFKRSPKFHRGMKGVVCAGGLRKSDTCSGDSGGPLQTPLSNNENNVVSIVGITSAGPDPCGNLPGIYINVANFIEWIEENVWPSKRATELLNSTMNPESTLSPKSTPALLQNSYQLT